MLEKGSGMVFKKKIFLCMLFSLLSGQVGLTCGSWWGVLEKLGLSKAPKGKDSYNLVLKELQEQKKKLKSLLVQSALLSHLLKKEQYDPEVEHDTGYLRETFERLHTDMILDIVYLEASEQLMRQDPSAFEPYLTERAQWLKKVNAQINRCSSRLNTWESLLQDLKRSIYQRVKSGPLMKNKRKSWRFSCKTLGQSVSIALLSFAVGWYAKAYWVKSS